MNTRKRELYKRNVQSALSRIMNDPEIMPNVDCDDLLVSINRIDFGRTVREIFIDVSARRRIPASDGELTPHERYLADANAKSDKTYIDLTDVLVFPKLMSDV